MKHFTISFIFALLVSIDCLGAEADVTGTWRLKSASRGRSFFSLLRIERRGEALHGVLVGSDGRERKLESLEHKDQQLSFQTSRPRDDSRFVMQYRGVISGDEIVGNAESQRGGEKRVWQWKADRADDFEASVDRTPLATADIELTDANYEVWRRHILPDSEDLAWKQIPWLSTFQDGILAADQAQKPLLLWTMNGHPLGCT